MIYLKNIHEAQTTFIPRNGDDVSDAMTLVLRNTIDQEKTIIPLTDASSFGGYFEVSLTLPEDIEDGEHQYTLFSDGNEVSNGLIIIGDLDSPDEYAAEITYRQYGTE